MTDLVDLKYFSLFALPLEIRQYIYDLLIGVLEPLPTWPSDKPLVSHNGKEHPEMHPFRLAAALTLHKNKESQKTLFNLTNTCKQVQLETQRNLELRYDELDEQQGLVLHHIQHGQYQAYTTATYAGPASGYRSAWYSFGVRLAFDREVRMERDRLRAYANWAQQEMDKVECEWAFTEYVEVDGSGGSQAGGTDK